jgi:hypothetical protein
LEPQVSEIQVLKVQDSEPQVLNIESPSFRSSHFGNWTKVHVSDIPLKIWKLGLFDVHEPFMTCKCGAM